VADRPAPAAGGDAAASLAEAELALGVGKAEQPLWRVTLQTRAAPGSHLLAMTFHHALADARSSASLAAELLAGCSSLAAGRPLPAAEPLPLLPPIEQCIPRSAAAPAGSEPGSGGGEAATATGESRAAAGTSAAEAATACWPYQGHAPLAERRTRLLQLPLPDGLWPILRRRCRAEGTTVQGAAMAALLCAAARSCGVADAGILPLASAVDLRRLAEPPPGAEHCGCYVTMLGTRHALADSRPFWELARECRQSLRQRLARQQAQGFAPRRFRPAALLAMIVDNLRRGEEQRVFPDGPALSNLGLLELTAGLGPFHLESLHFSTAQLAGLHLLFLTLVALGDGRLCGWLGYAEPLLARETARAIAEWFIEELSACCRES